ncbi:MAG: YfhO family protein, partial [Candidatus Kapaibacterium sp.]
MLPQHYHVRWLIAALALILGITFFPYLFGGRTFLPVDLFDTMMAPWNAEYGLPQAQNHYIFDGLAQTYPYKVQTKEALEKGKFAYWNPHILGGYPQYAETLANNFDIYNMLLVWMSPLDFMHWQTVLELLTAGIGMIFLLRFFGISPLINLLFSTAYMLNSMFIQTAMNRWIVASFCWMPFVVLMILRYFHNDRKENLLYASVFLALIFLGGNFQTSFFAVFVIAIIALWYPSINPVHKIAKRMTVLIGISVAAFALSAFMWLPTLELFIQTLFHGGSLHSDINPEHSIVHRLITVLFLPAFFFPEIMGNAQTYNLKNIAGVDVMNFNGAIGFLPLLFALWGCWILR